MYALFLHENGEFAMNLRTLRLLEYNKIVEMLASYAASPMAKRKCERIKPRKDLAMIQSLQQETRDALIRVQTQGNLSFAGLRDIGASIKRLEVYADKGTEEEHKFVTLEALGEEVE